MKTIFHRMLQEILDVGDDYASDATLIQYSRELIAKKSLLPCLYRYSKADYNNIRAFENRSIFLAKVGSLNDIFEGFSSESYSESMKIVTNLTKLPSDVLRFMKRSTGWITMIVF